LDTGSSGSDGTTAAYSGAVGNAEIVIGGFVVPEGWTALIAAQK